MKKIFILVVAACAMATQMAKAEPFGFMSETPQPLTMASSAPAAVPESVSVSTRSNAAWGGHNIYFAYKPTSIIWKGESAEDYKEAFPAKNSIALGYAFSIPMGQSNAMFRAQLELQYTFGKYSAKEYNSSFSMLAINWGLGVGYSFAFPNNRIQIQPFVQLNLRENCLGRLAIDYDSKNIDDVTYALFDDSEYYSGGSDKPIPMGKNAWEWVQFGVDLGVDFQFGLLSLGVSYVVDFTKLVKYEDVTGTFSPVSLKVGVAF